MSIDVSVQKAFDLKSASLTIPVMLLTSNELPVIEEQLGKKVAQAADFFKHSPLLIDLQQLNRQGLPVDLDGLMQVARRQGLMPIGIRGGSEQQNRDMLAMNLPVHSLPGGTSAADNCAPGKARPARDNSSQDSGAQQTDNQQSAQTVENKLINQPVRSGQRVYARGDLIVTATVSAGAEIMAEGNIHVYGTLRGRALAGVLGDTNSRIFCMDLQAELISIAGIYQLRDDINKNDQHKAVKISLEDQALVIKNI